MVTKKCILKNPSIPLQVMLLLIANFFYCVSVNCISSVVVLKMNELDISLDVICRVLICYTIGLTLGTIFASKILEALGHEKSYFICIVGISLLIFSHIFYFNPIFWSVLIFFIGLLEIIVFVNLVSWINKASANKNRGVAISLFMLTGCCGISLGQMVLRVSDEQNYIMFSILGFVALLSMLFVKFVKSEKVEVKVNKKVVVDRIVNLLKKISVVKTLKNLIKVSVGLLGKFKKAPIGAVVCFISGATTGLISSVGVIYIIKSGLGKDDASTFMSVVFLGAMLFQLPIGKICDKLDRRVVLMFCSISMLLVSIFGNDYILMGGNYLAAFALIIGGFIFVLYPIALGYTNNRINEDEVISVNAMLSFFSRMGAICAPLLTSTMIDRSGPIGFMYIIAGFSIILGISSVLSFLHKEQVVLKA